MSLIDRIAATIDAHSKTRGWLRRGDETSKFIDQAATAIFAGILPVQSQPSDATQRQAQLAYALAGQLALARSEAYGIAPKAPENAPEE